MFSELLQIRRPQFSVIVKVNKMCKWGNITEDAFQNKTPHLI